MEFHHSEDRQMLAATLSRFLMQRYGFQRRLEIATSEQGWSAEQWRELAELGIVGALLDPASGGFGGTGFDIAVVFEQLGRALVVEPFLGALMASRALARTGGHEPLLEELGAGSSILAFAHEEPQSHYELGDVAAQAESGADGWKLSGAKAVVPQIEAANHIIVSARISGNAHDEMGIGLFLIAKDAAGLAVRGYPMIDGGRGGELTLDRTPAKLLSDNAYSVIEESVAAGIVALSWEAYGIMEMLRDATLDYLRTRKQFGVPIGKFQALQHRLATMALEVEQARSAAINAADALSGERHTRERAMSAAKYTIGRVGTLVAEESIQMHGGIGMTWELPVSHYAKRLTMIGHQLGDEDYHLSRYVTLGRAA